MKNRLLTIAIFTLAFSACFNGQHENEGTLTINLGGRGNGRSAGDVAWPPSSWNNGIYFSYPTKFIVTLDGPTGRKVESFDFETSRPYTDTKISFTVAPGRWNINIEIRIHDSFLYATGSSTANVNAGQSSSVGITMNQKYYRIGDTGPADGIIFYVNPEGFTMTDTGETCHYLEAAPQDCVVGSTTTFAWAPLSTLIDTINDEVGVGRMHTKSIIKAVGPGTTYAAQVCVALTTGGHSDWFLPSYNELYLMYENLHKEGLGGFLSAYYYSSSMIDDISVKSLKFYDGEVYPDWFYDTNRVRAIRAF